MFGIQWDLVLKHLEINGEWDESNTPQYYLTSNSSDWGNYRDIGFDIDRGGYSESPSTANSFTSVNGTYQKPENSSVLLTTGATERNNRMNIYDLAGNVYEWTLEKSTGANAPCVIRGGYYSFAGSGSPASNRRSDSTSSSYDLIGFRPALY